MEDLTLTDSPTTQAVNPEDALLIAQLRQGDAEAGRQFVREYYPGVYRYLLYRGYKVRYVRNITDAGHFEEEGREAEDKISTKAHM